MLLPPFLEVLWMDLRGFTDNNTHAFPEVLSKGDLNIFVGKPQKCEKS